MGCWGRGKCPGRAENRNIWSKQRPAAGGLVENRPYRTWRRLAADGYSFQHKDVFLSYQQRAQALGKGIWREYGAEKAVGSRR